MRMEKNMFEKPCKGWGVRHAKETINKFMSAFAYLLTFRCMAIIDAGKEDNEKRVFPGYRL